MNWGENPGKKSDMEQRAFNIALFRAVLSPVMAVKFGQDDEKRFCIKPGNRFSALSWFFTCSALANNDERVVVTAESNAGQFKLVSWLNNIWTSELPLRGSVPLRGSFSHSSRTDSCGLRAGSHLLGQSEQLGNGTAEASSWIQLQLWSLNSRRMTGPGTVVIVETERKAATGTQTRRRARQRRTCSCARRSVHGFVPKLLGLFHCFLSLDQQFVLRSRRGLATQSWRMLVANCQLAIETDDFLKIRPSITAS
ncbi:hypothetical protein T10_10488 [Trichinella papuae]|nr:hypothetical protein T10_10488 [Trichinella papuae]